MDRKKMNGKFYINEPFLKFALIHFQYWVFNCMFQFRISGNDADIWKTKRKSNLTGIYITL